ncbi:hypothetical protein DPMN_082087 [Dreissena polymorpha]|uniref:Uncharacterized protein n=1 Tax=Dreissena polymorpha TaxID=45954 RepID=A0A9D3Y7H8_DREPO|nr:hypothetical protein DPMN_082087 [Dreissena polymorpha]
MNLLTKFNEDQIINVAPIVKNVPPLGSNVFQANATIFELFHQDWTINVASRLLTREKSPPRGGHFHEDLTIYVVSRVITRFYYSHSYIYIEYRNSRHKVVPECYTAVVSAAELLPNLNALHSNPQDIKVSLRKNAQPPGGHIFQATGTIFELGTNLLTMFPDDRTILLASRVKMPRPIDGHVFPPTGTIFVLIQHIIRKNRLTKLHDDRKTNVASRVLIRNNAPPPGGHVFIATETIFELIQDIMGTHFF